MSYSLSARRLKEALDDKGMKPQELSNLSGVNKSSLSQYINGSHTPSNISAGKMAKVLGVSPLWLMGFPDSTKIDIEEIRTELIVTRLEYMSIPLDQKDKLEEYEKKLNILEKRIKEGEEINDKSKYAELDANLRHRLEEKSKTPKVVHLPSEILPSTEATNQALRLFQKYQDAPENVRSAIDALLGSVPPQT